MSERLNFTKRVIDSLSLPATGADVTAGYIVASTERLREPMQKITDFVLKAAGLKPTADIIELRREAVS